ncbi:MAG TPA: site-specific integrase [Firmicutes bacterium]|nr:site-specific integrase [Bacillota bacterium]
MNDKKKRKKRRGNGEGTIFQRKEDKLWVGQAVIGYNPLTGKPKRKTVYGKTRAEAAKKLAKISVLVAEGNYTDTDLTVQEWLNTWLKDYMINALRPKTYDSYEKTIQLHINPQIGKVKLKDLTTDRIQKLYNQKFKNGRVDGKGGLAPRSVERIHTVLNGALEQAVITRKIGFNPSNGTILPIKIQKEVRALTPKEQMKFESTLKGERLQTGFLLGLYGGLRRGEILGLQWPDFDFERSTVTIKRALLRIKDKETGESRLSLEPLKTKKSYRTIPLPEEFMIVLKEHKAKQTKEKHKAGPIYQDQNMVFCTALGTFIEPRNFNRIFYRIRDKANIKDFTLHGLRHTFVTRLLEMNVNQKIIQEFVGHTRSTTTDDYAHVLWNLMLATAEKLNNNIQNRKNSSPEEE